MAIAALSQLLHWGVANIAAALTGVTTEIATRAIDLGLEVLPEAQRGPHMLGLRLPEAVRQRIVPALAERSCFAAVRGGSLRIAPHLHTTTADVECLFAVLAGAILDQNPGESAGVTGARRAEDESACRLNEARPASKTYTLSDP